jgi:vacuolar-type H+-ATPase subunit F/Vma7
LNPEWPEESVKMDELCNGDVNRPLLFEIWDWDRVGKHDLIGRFTTTVHMILTGHTEYDVINPEKQKKKKKYENSGKFKINFKPIQTYSFLQYLQSGVQVSLTVAVDFTGSNGSPNLPSSLHYLGTSLNEYQEAIEKIGSIVCPYDTDQRFSLFGFGGVYKGDTNHCFPLNGNDNDPEVPGLLGLMTTYREAVPKYALSGPTHFEQVLKQTRKLAERTKGTTRTYYVLLILTDGQINDQNETIKEIVESSDDPISIIIVGVGSADFSTMEVLDGDNGKLRHGKKEAQRDVVQFVPFRKHKTDPYALAQEVLAEVPRQLVSYYESVHYVPQLPVYHPQPVQYAPPPQQPQPVVQPVQPVVVTTTTTTTATPPPK